MFSFPFFQAFVIATLGFNRFPCVRVLVDLHLAGFARAGLGRSHRSTSAALRIQQVDHILEAIAVLGEQIAKFGFEFNFFLKAGIAF